MRQTDFSDKLSAEKIASFEKDDRERILAALDLAGNTGAASILLELGLNADTIIAALLLAEFGDRSLPESLNSRFGPAVTLLARGVQKIDSLRTNNNTITKTISEAKNIRNMLFALTEDIRVILILLAKRLHALRELDSAPEEERKAAARHAARYAAQESLDIYAPLAGRLGISRIKDEMEDLALKFLNREAYQQIKDIVVETQEERNLFLEQTLQTVKAETKAAGINVEVKSRAKHFYSVYMKMRKRGVSLNDIYDLFGIRIICDSIENCYTILGIVHRLWKPITGTFKDYIAMPKSNGYSSLHTSVMAGADTEKNIEGRRLEIQIRTHEMHQIAENGVASHWLYKKGSSRDTVRRQDIGIVNKLKDWKQNEQGDTTGAWLEDIKREILSDSIYVFTPQGKVIELPAGSTPIDFAYCVHTEIGSHCIGAKANGAIVPLSSPLKNTQVVEILTSPSARPHLNWLHFAKTSKARNKIRSWLSHNDEAFSADKTPAENEKPAQELPPPPEIRPPAQMVIQPENDVLKVTIEDEKNLMVRFARCCHPVTGDDIIGYVSRGRGVIIHRKSCANLANIPEFAERKIEAGWENAGSVLVKRFRVEARRSENLFSEIEGAVRRRQGHLIEGRLEETSANRLTGFFTMQIEKADDLKAITANIRGIPGIISIQALN